MADGRGICCCGEPERPRPSQCAGGMGPPLPLHAAD
jgi:hypothetical protein